MKFFQHFILLFLSIMLYASSVNAQDYKENLIKWQHQYKLDFFSDSHSPIKSSDTAFIKFYSPNKTYCVNAKFIHITDSQIMNIPTHNKKTKQFKKYGMLQFKLKGKAYSLYVYQNIQYLSKDSNALFLPFTDLTNYTTTYGGGRYIDLSIKDLKDGKILLDFNKAYNPYCAFGGDYSCPIPPVENSLNIKIKAGEKLFAKKQD